MIIAALAFIAATSVPASIAPASGMSQTAVAAPTLLNEDDLLLYSATLDSLTLTETLTAYGDANDPLLPLGELARLLDLDLSVSMPAKRVTGNIGEARRPITLDFLNGVGRVGNKDVRLGVGDVGFTEADIYVRASRLSEILPLKADVSAEALSIQLVPVEKLPIQLRMDRLARLRGLNPGKGLDREPA